VHTVRLHLAIRRRNRWSRAKGLWLLGPYVTGVCGLSALLLAVGSLALFLSAVSPNDDAVQQEFYRQKVIRVPVLRARSLNLSSLARKDIPRTNAHSHTLNPPLPASLTSNPPAKTSAISVFVKLPIAGRAPPFSA